MQVTLTEKEKKKKSLSVNLVRVSAKRIKYELYRFAIIPGDVVFFYFVNNMSLRWVKKRYARPSVSKQVKKSETLTSL